MFFSTARIVLLGLVFLMAGCAETPERRLRDLPQSLRLEQEQGMLALKMTSNQLALVFGRVSLDGITPAITKWDTLIVRNVGTDESSRVYDRDFAGAAHADFVAPLVAGTYELIAAETSIAEGTGYRTFSVSLRGFAPSFRIEAGKLTDLGTLLFWRPYSPVNTRGFTWAHANGKYDEGSALDGLSSEVSTALRRSPRLTWLADTRLTQLRDAYSALKRHSMMGLSPVVLADGTLLLGESSGVVTLRSVDGHWSFIETPTSLTIRSVFRTRAGDLFVGADDGLLMYQKAGADEWQKLKLPDLDASVLYIGTLPGSDRLLVILRTWNQFVALVNNQNATEPWESLVSLPRSLGGSRNLDAKGAVIRSGNTLVLATGNRGGELVIFDGSEKRWRVSKTDAYEAYPVAWTGIPGEGIGRFQLVSLEGVTFFSSKDYGQSWEKGGVLNGVFGRPLFVSERKGYAIRVENRAILNPDSSEYALWVTENAGQTWRQLAPLPGLHGHLIKLHGDQELGYVSYNGKFFVSKDGGKSWVLDRELPQ